MRRSICALLALSLAACATQDEPSEMDAVNDFIAVSELESVDAVRSMHPYHYSVLTDRHIILKTRRESYLVQFRRRCRELNNTLSTTITPDVRHERNVLRARFDTIRGCVIDQIFAIDDAHAQELKQLGEAPGE